MNSSRVLGPELLRQLGIPVHGCRKAVITLEIGEPIQITAEYTVTAIDPVTDFSMVQEYTRKFTLVEESNAPKIRADP
jgi:repressor of nif and glnA expression